MQKKFCQFEYQKRHRIINFMKNYSFVPLLKKNVVIHFLLNSDTQLFE